MGCLSWGRKKSSLPEPQRIIETPRLVEVVPERRQTIRATTEFKWPARISDVAPTSSVTQLHQQIQPVPEKEVLVSTPTSFLSPRTPSPLHMMHHNHHQPDYHISPQVYSCQQCRQDGQIEQFEQQLQQQKQQKARQRQYQQPVPQKKQKYPTGSQQEPAELPPNDLSELYPLPQELPAGTPPLIFPQELEGTLGTPISKTAPRTIPRSRFSYQT
ncbi:hypothetical protein M406DRAFT_355458 [Cryphonectria parasitica EP155]|uniref:Uncharacterized protein n=1 Tax=Cryphonectria parasitica (strain ATCC 38755 / EP155) TaxID=660469 RepID=A0A9P4Y5Z1_CRYP1|nr:uncharacterized protein M406DRAFT_355458 [Cryphonectria parasitica EP155]KAF3767069.1 hypothetical protein M406DRAFT_355458 [Cryphonectria parasitica EP155]